MSLLQYYGQTDRHNYSLTVVFSRSVAAFSQFPTLTLRLLMSHTHTHTHTHTHIYIYIYVYVTLVA